MLKGTEEIQLALEDRRKEEAIAKFIRLNTVDGKLDSSSHGKTLLELGFDPFKDKLDEYFGLELKTNSLKTRQFLQLMSENTSVIAFLVLGVVISRLAGNPVSLSSLSRSVVNRLLELNFFDMVKREDPKLFAYLGKEFKRASATRKRQLIKKHTETLDYDNIGEDKAPEIIRVGTTLLSILIQSGANIIEVKHQSTRGKKALKVVVLTQEATEVLINMLYHNIQFNINPAYYPMVVPPNDWGEGVKGGYLHGSTPMFIGNKKITRHFLRNKSYPTLYPVINKAQQVSWRINTRVLDTLQDIFQGNLIDYGNPAILPKLYGGLPTSNVYKPTDLISKEQYEDWVTYNRELDKLQMELDGENGRRLSLLMALDVANEMVDYEEFYYPYQFDYRGRLYPVTNFLNPQSPKHIKALLEFSKGEVLNEEGVKWLKIHIANTYGLDKASFDERIKWTEAHISIILAIAKDPLDFVKDWAYCDSPYEFLASCFAYEDYTKGLPVYTPIQLDATCSGIQFYSGLLLDKEGAESVNVIGDTRQDIYQKVADKVNYYLEVGDYPKEILFKDSEGAERIAYTLVEASSIKGKVTRSLVKRNTMTVPYSVTMRGMSDQLWDEMEILERKGKAFWSGDRWVVNKLLTFLNHKAIYEVVQGAKLGQDYLIAVAGTIKQPAIWHTPLYNFPVLQPAVKDKECKVSTVFGHLMTYSESTQFAAGKQRSGIAPNIIHSLDAELLRYVIENFEGDIGTVHDCFLVHPNQGEQVRDNYKKGYVKLMETSPLSYIGRQIDTEGTILVPCVGTLDLQDVYNSMYIIS